VAEIIQNFLPESIEFYAAFTEIENERHAM